MAAKEADTSDHVEKHILRRLELCQRLGKGAYGVVWKAIEKRNKQQRYQSPSTWNSNYQYGNSYTTSSSRAGLARANSAQQWQQRPGQDSSNQHHCA